MFLSNDFLDNNMKKKRFEFEICANSVESCLAAQEAGADRVELCAGIPEGGTTPSYAEIWQARQLLDRTKLHVIIRPRGGDFLYPPAVLERMAVDIDLCRRLGVDGVVFGCLNRDGDVDMDANAFLVEHAKGMTMTFHRAFDHCRKPLEALENIVELGFDKILTSGQQPTALQGVELLAVLRRKAKGRVAVMAGCGVNEHNIAKIFQATGITEYHFSARVPVASQMLYHNEKVYMGAQDADEMAIQVTSVSRVRDTMEALAHFEAGLDVEVDFP